MLSSRTRSNLLGTQYHWFLCVSVLVSQCVCLSVCLLIHCVQTWSFSLPTKKDAKHLLCYSTMVNDVSHTYFVEWTKCWEKSLNSHFVVVCQFSGLQANKSKEHGHEQVYIVCHVNEFVVLFATLRLCQHDQLNFEYSPLTKGKLSTKSKWRSFDTFHSPLINKLHLRKEKKWN